MNHPKDIYTHTHTHTHTHRCFDLSMPKNINLSAQKSKNSVATIGRRQRHAQNTHQTITLIQSTLLDHCFVIPLFLVG
jgi:hypothetical protein